MSKLNCIKICKLLRLYQYFVYICFVMYLITTLYIAGFVGFPTSIEGSCFLKFANQLIKITQLECVYFSVHFFIIFITWMLNFIFLILITILCDAKERISFRINEDIWFIRKTVSQYSTLEIRLLWVSRILTLLVLASFII